MNFSKSIFYVFILVLGSTLTSCNQNKTATANAEPEKTTASQAKPVVKKAASSHLMTGDLQWYTIEEALEMNKNNDKMLFVDVYTEWCGWCKVMDKKTFTVKEVQDYIRDNFIPVKFDAEQKSAISFGGKDYKFVAGGRRGHHELAVKLLNGRLGYPSFAYLDGNLKNLKVSAGYKKPEQLMAEMKNIVAGNM